MRSEPSIALCGALVCALTWGCGTDLGPCDETMLGGSSTPGAERPHDGQHIINRSCAGGGCHSALAKGDGRAGAPAGLDFDTRANELVSMEMVEAGAEMVRQEIDHVWHEIEEGAMPPPMPAGPGPLSAQDKETVRNWLACDAPVIHVPVDAGGGGDDPWSMAFGTLNALCLSCHGEVLVGNTFTLATSKDACMAYDNATTARAASPSDSSCADLPMIEPGNPDGSYLLRKLEGTGCGSPMPPQGALADSNPAVVQQLRQWIADGAARPPSCP
ncbi:MAG: hypothetical protein OEZ06_10320 [Myxococcales bacterium]|nr:hypothetical protein [Myxococcales bacterium]